MKRTEENEAPSFGYAWTLEEQERELPAEDVRLHHAILDDYDEDDLEAFDPEGRNDYILWAAAQAFEELEQGDAAFDLLKRIAAARAPHPALDYPGILLRLGEYLRDRGDYAEALALLDRVGRDDAGRREECDERRAEILVLSGELQKGLWLFEKAAGRAPGDPWVPVTAAWALLQRGEHDRIPGWLERAEKALRDVTDEDEAREAASEIDRLRGEAEARRSRRAAADEPADPDDLRGRREAILAEVDAFEVGLVRTPPRAPDARARAAGGLAALHARASRAWDDAVEAGDEEMIAAFDDLQWEIVGLAERFGIPVPGEVLED